MLLSSIFSLSNVALQVIPSSPAACMSRKSTKLLNSASQLATGPAIWQFAFQLFCWNKSLLASTSSIANDFFPERNSMLVRSSPIVLMEWGCKAVEAVMSKLLCCHKGIAGPEIEGCLILNSPLTKTEFVSELVEVEFVVSSNCQPNLPSSEPANFQPSRLTNCPSRWVKFSRSPLAVKAPALVSALPRISKKSVVQSMLLTAKPFIDSSMVPTNRSGFAQVKACAPRTAFKLAASMLTTMRLILFSNWLPA